MRDLFAQCSFSWAAEDLQGTGLFWPTSSGQSYLALSRVQTLEVFPGFLETGDQQAAVNFPSAAIHFVELHRLQRLVEAPTRII